MEASRKGLYRISKTSAGPKASQCGRHKRRSPDEHSRREMPWHCRVFGVFGLLIPARNDRPADANGIATVEAVAEGAVIEIHVVFRSPVRELTEFAEEVI